MYVIGWLIGGISLLYSIIVYCLVFQRVLRSNIKKYQFRYYIISLFFSSYLAVTFLGLVDILRYKNEAFEIFTILGLIVAGFVVFSLRSLVEYTRMKNENTKLSEKNERLKMEYDHLKFHHKKSLLK